ncbi:hypothetical protein T439DRAFT_326965 [Meredithblackwellia eburnea MCA 4105]
MDASLLASIQKGKGLKKVTTVDKSGPVGAGRSLDGPASSSAKAPAVRPPPAARQDDDDEAPPKLAGLFAGGMPTLKKSTGGVSTGKQL